MECTLSGVGTSHRVNSILVKKQTQVENQAINELDELQPPTKRICRRSLPPEAFNNEIPKYYSGKRVGPGKLKELERFKIHRSKLQSTTAILYLDRASKIKTASYPSCSRMDRLKCSNCRKQHCIFGHYRFTATDLKTAFEVLCRASEIRDRLNLKAVACVFDQSFYRRIDSCLNT